MTLALQLLLVALIIAGAVALIVLARRHQGDAAAAAAWLQTAAQRAQDHSDAKLDEVLELLRTDTSIVGHAVMVSTIGDTAVRGIVHADLPDRLTLRDAVVMTVGTDAQAPAAGLLHVPRERVDVVQELPPPPVEET